MKDELQHGRYAATFFPGGNFIGQAEYEDMLQRANLTGTRLDRAVFGGADLTGANFRSATLKGADFRGATLRNANFNGADSLSYAVSDGTARVLLLLHRHQRAGVGTFDADENREEIGLAHQIQ